MGKANAMTANTIRDLVLGMAEPERTALVAELVRRTASSLTPEQEAERARIDRMLVAVNGSVEKAADVLGWSRRGLQLRMRKLGMPRQRSGPKPKPVG